MCPDSVLPASGLVLVLCAGPIPPELGRLAALKQLFFSGNMLTGKKGSNLVGSICASGPCSLVAVGWTPLSLPPWRWV